MVCSFALHHGNCCPLMNSAGAYNTVDMVLADLPYGATQNFWDVPLDLYTLWKGYENVTKPGAPVVLTAIQPFTSELVMSNLRGFRYEWIWSKNKASGHLNAKKRPLRSHESVLVFCDTPPPYFPQMTDGHKVVGSYKRGRNSDNYGHAEPTVHVGSTVRYPKSVQEFDVMNNDDPERTHPTQKPLDLLRYLIRTYTTVGSTVLDNTMGTGSTGVACALEGRKLIGIEMNEKFFSIAQQRVAAAYAGAGN